MSGVEVEDALLRIDCRADWELCAVWRMMSMCWDGRVTRDFGTVAVAWQDP